MPIAAQLAAAPQVPNPPISVRLVGAAITLDGAERLDAQVDDNLRSYGADLVRHYLAIGSALREVQETTAWKTLGYRSWTKYLEGKREYGRAWIFALAKLGRASYERIMPFIDDGLSATKLVEYARVARTPEEIHLLMAATEEDAKVLTVRQLGKTLKAIVADWHADDPQPVKGAGRRPGNPLKKFEKLLEGLSEGEREAFRGEVMNRILSLPVKEAN